MTHTSATIGSKHDINKQGRRVILIYKAHMCTKASLDPERCTHKSDEKARRRWLQTHLRQIDQYEDINNPIGEQQEDDNMEKEDAEPRLPAGIDISPNGSGAQTHIGGTTVAAAATGTSATGVLIQPVVTRLRFGPPKPPTIPIRDGVETHTRTISGELQNMFALLRQQRAN